MGNRNIIEKYYVIIMKGYGQYHLRKGEDYLQVVLPVPLLRYPIYILLFLMSMSQFFYQFPSLTSLGGILVWLL